MAFSQILARLGVQLGLDTASFETGSRKAQKEAKGLEKGMSKIGKVAGAIGAAFVASGVGDLARSWADATKTALDFAGGLGETAQQLGVTTDELQEYRYVATQTGIEQSEMDKALQKTTRTLGELATPTKAQAAALKELGVSAKDLEGLGTGDFLVLLADKFKGLTAAEQAALGTQLGLGRSFQTLIPLLNEGSAGIERMREEARELGIVISEEAIKNADANADTLATWKLLADAQSNAALTTEENIKAFMSYEKTILDVKLAFYDLIGSLNSFGDNWQAVNDRATVALAPFRKGVRDTALAVFDFATNAPQWIGQMVTAIGTWVSGRLNAIWDGVQAKIETVKAGFFGLYDAVVGHSYIPDMVDGIAAQMQRLDAVMVAPVTKATTKAQEAFRDMAGNVQSLLDRLFPEVRRLLNYRADLQLIEGSGLSAEQQREARRRLGTEFGGGGGTAEPDFSNVKPLDEGVSKVGDAIERLTERAKIASLRIAESFKDMVQNISQSLSGLASAIKGGGFFDIVNGLVNFGLQLGGAGVFGSKIATALNRVPAYAGGTNFHPGGMALVGERGPELVPLPRGSRVIPNHALTGPTIVHLVVEPGQVFVPTVEAISGSVSVQQISRAGKSAMRQQRQAL